MMDWETCSAIESNPQVLSGALVFQGTRVPLHALFENLQGGATIDQFVDWFPNVALDQVNAVLNHQIKVLRQFANQ